MKAIVFGGAGFLGSFVADALVAAGHEVVVFDRVPSPYLQPPQTGVVGDILDKEAVARAIEGCDVVYHYAGIADIAAACADPVEAVRVNVLGTTMLLDAARRAGITRFLFASTLYVYSRAGLFYRSGKQACELLIDDYRRAFGLHFTILRYGSLYGPRTSEDNSIHRLLRDALVTGRLVRDGDGEEIRDYVHVWDAALASVDALRDEFADTNLIVSGGRPIRVRELLDMIREMLGGTTEIEYRPIAGPAEHAPHGSGIGPGLHYRITPYAFQPELARTLVRPTHIDLGQGILSLLHELKAELPSAGTRR